MPRYAVTGTMRVRCACTECDGRGWVRDEVAAERVEVEMLEPVDLSSDAQRKRILTQAEEVALTDRDDVEEVEKWDDARIEEIDDAPPSPCAVMRAAGVPMLFEELA